MSAERCFEGTRAFSTQGIDKAIFNLFKMYAKLGDKQVSLVSSGAKDTLSYADAFGRGVGPDIDGVAALSGSKSLTVLVYSHHDDWDLDGNAAVELEVANLPFETTRCRVEHYRVDADHSNPYPEWIRQGKPMYPTAGQMAAIKSRDGLEMLEPPQVVTAWNGKVRLNFTLPIRAVSLLVITPAKQGWAAAA